MLRKFKKDINNELKTLVRQSKPFLVPAVKYDLLYKGIKDFLLRDGKRIRPSFFILSYMGYSKKKLSSYKKLVKCALSLELLHDFLLVHDDVIDNSELRRGKPTLQKIFNKNLKASPDAKIGSDISIMAGDVIFAMAVESFLSFDVTSLRAKKALSKLIKAAAETGIGEYIDTVNNIKKIEQVSERDIFLTYMLKTAKYTFETPLLMGATLAGAENAELKKLSKLGIALGRAFQIHDDLLDVFSSTEQIGKPVLSDLNESKKTLLVLRAFQALRGKQKKSLKKILSKKKKTYGDLLRFRKLIKISGANKYCADKTLSLLDEARSICDGLRMKAKFKNELMRLIREMALETESLIH
jgi:geranylgeranyl diphosphate synthase type I